MASLAALTTRLDRFEAALHRRVAEPRWVPLDWQVPVLADRSPVVLLTGSVGGGKSAMWRQMVHRFCVAHPGAFWLVMRKTQESMDEGAMAQMQFETLGAAELVKSTLRYRNGSRVVFRGMADARQRTRIRSVGTRGDVDGIVMEEANEFNEPDFNELEGRLRGRAGPYRQMIIATNPDAPTHWINQRMILGGEASVHYSKAADNVHHPPDYQERIERMTGTEYQRLVLGKWVQAEGVVHDNWNAAVNVVDRFPLDHTWRRVGGIDYGQEHPTAAQWWAVDGDGRMILYREIHKTRMAVEDLAEMMAAYNAEDVAAGANAATFHYDHAAGIRLRGVPCRPANKTVEAGLKAVNQRLRKAGDGRPRMMVFCDALVHPPDPRQVAAHKPTCLAEEMDVYCWDVRQDGWNKDQPLKMNDDGCDACRYATMAVDRPRRGFATFQAA